LGVFSPDQAAGTGELEAVPVDVIEAAVVTVIGWCLEDKVADLIAELRRETEERWVLLVGARAARC
jgi:hypothetical protein